MLSIFLGYCAVCYGIAGIYAWSSGLFSGRSGNSGDLGLIFLLLFAPVALPWFALSILKDNLGL